MVEVEFNYFSEITIIQCNSNEKMKDIIKRFAIKIQKMLRIYISYMEELKLKKN